MDNEIISIIVAVYNAEKYIESCVESILGQTYPDIQIILVNDGSQDDSLSICYRIAEKRKNVIVIDKENEGCFSAWNKGLEVATGAFIGFVDNDDYIMPEMYSVLMELMKKYQSDIAVCNRYRNVDNANDYSKMNRTTDIVHEFTGVEAVFHLMSDTRHIKPAVWDKLYRRKIFEGEIFPNTFFEDAGLSYKLLYKAKKVVVTEKQLYAYSVRTGSMITSPWNMTKTSSLIMVTSSAINFFKERGMRELENAAIFWQIQFSIEAWERALKSESATKEDFSKIATEVKKNYADLDLNILNFSIWKNIKKKIEFYLFIMTPNFLCKLKRITLKRG